MSVRFDDIKNKQMMNFALPEELEWQNQTERFSMKAAEKNILLASMSFIVILSWLSAVFVSCFSSNK